MIINIVPTPKFTLQGKMLMTAHEDEKHKLGVMVKDGRLKHMNASAFGVTDKAQNYMMMMKTLEDLDYAVKMWNRLPTWNPLAQCIVVSIDPLKVEEKDELVKNVLARLLADGMINAIVVYHLLDDPNLLAAETWFPYYNSSCGTQIENIFKIEECRVTKIHNKTTQRMESESLIQSFNENLFPRIPRNFRGCFLNVSAFIREPFVVRSDDQNGKLIGLEVKMLTEISFKLNLKIRFRILKGNPLTKKINSNNVTGIYADILQK